MNKRIRNVGCILAVVLCFALCFSVAGYDDSCTEHDWDYDEPIRCEYYDDEYHTCVYRCMDCDATTEELEEHNLDDEECVREAGINKDGIVESTCYDCDTVFEGTFPWTYNGEDCLTYDIKDHSAVYKNSTSITVKLTNPLEGGTVRVKIGDKKFEKKLTNNDKKVKVKIKKSKYGSKIKIELLYNGKVVGKDDCDQWDNVLYAKDIKKGMTKKQVKYLYYWGSPDSSASSSGGWSFWYYDDGSEIAFKKGKVYSWYNAAG